MFEKVTDRLFWTLSSIIVGSLIAIILMNAYPQLYKSNLNPFASANTYNIVDPKGRVNHHAPQSKVINQAEVPIPPSSDQVSPDYE